MTEVAKFHCSSEILLQENLLIGCKGNLIFSNQQLSNKHNLRYITLRRSHRDADLVIVVDQKSEALAKSVSMLDENGDILSVNCN